ncbi:sensor histidine kinase [Arthrobacter sp. UM1]|uniref:sensor histidine kinase n=1 Tax=Arthrobacter sp. UM1 TaxID=2766776 RepID=UPI001CF6FDED|nr:ATP-binding protein [Arthrobacter sp. UM1]MCB4208609.1 sensor histidine kinase [Arthrobacter sp. UM1]
MRTSPDSATDLLVRGLRVGVHVAFAVLLGFALVQHLVVAHGGPAERWTVVAVSAVLAAVYVAGTAVERRLAVRAGYGARPVIPARHWVSWLAAVVLLWAVLVFHDAGFAYCAFPLFFVVLHLVRPLGAGVLGIAGLLALLVAAFGASGQLASGAVVGPTIGAGFAVVVFIVYEALVRDSLEQRRALAELEAARSELAAAHHAAGVAAERERFSGEIHDTLAQGLNAIVLTARAGLAAEASPGSGSASAQSAALERILELASANLAEARDIVRGSAALGPRAQDDSLEHAIRAAIERVGVGRLDLLIRDERPREAAAVPLDPAVRRLVVLAASSLAANVVRHAEARRAVITLGSPDPGVLAMDVVDDGRGFTPSAVVPGFGLSSLRDRVERLGGALVVESEPGEGTAVNVRIPVGAETHKQEGLEA